MMTGRADHRAGMASLHLSRSKEATMSAAIGVKSPLLLYVNVPFCNSKCHFCDWVAQIPIADLRLGQESEGRRGHLEAVQAQIAAQAPELVERYRPEIMYWGGGTASILNAREI